MDSKGIYPYLVNSFIMKVLITLRWYYKEDEWSYP